MAFVRVGSISSLAPGWVTEAKVDGHPYAICNEDGTLYCIDGECCCTGGPVGQGSMRFGLVVCPWHGWRFDYKTGVCAYDESIVLPTFAVKVDGDDILIDVEQRLNID